MTIQFSHYTFICFIKAIIIFVAIYLLISMRFVLYSFSFLSAVEETLHYGDPVY
jgi:predicted branched-subunit amino acid permease